MAEEARFELAISIAQDTAFREQRLQPLGHSSISLFYQICSLNNRNDI